MITLLLVDGRPVRRRRFIKSLEYADDLQVVGAISALELLEDTLRQSPAQVLVVDGGFTDTEYYPTFEAQAKKLGCAIVPIWDYPTSDAEQTQQDILENRFGDFESQGTDPRLLLLIETLRDAGLRSKTGKAPPAVARGASAVAAMTVPNEPLPVTKAPLIANPQLHSDLPILGIGSSTGGVQALSEVLRTFEADCPPTLIVQHMPPEFVASFAQRLDRLCKAHVRVATDGATLQPGLILIAPGDKRHMRVTTSKPQRVILEAGDPVSGHIPSVDVLFNSLSHLGPKAKCALLTGMGADGAKGLLAVKTAGGSTSAQDENSCVVFGMPKEAIDLGAADVVLDLRRIGHWLTSALIKA